MAENRIGLDGKCYYGAKGSTAANEMTNVKDVTLNLSAREADTTTRAAVTWATSKVVLLEGTLEFEMNDQVGDAGLTAIKNAFLTKDLVALFPKDAASGEGLDADYAITSFNRNEPLEDVITYSVTAKPSDELRTPQWV